MSGQPQVGHNQHSGILRFARGSKCAFRGFARHYRGGVTPSEPHGGSGVLPAGEACAGVGGWETKREGGTS